MTDVDEAARVLDDAATSATPIPQFSRIGPSLTLDEAYEVQRLLVVHRTDRGERIVGLKVGFTSRAKMRQMGVSDVIWGRLTDAMRVEDGGAVDLGSFVHPRVEPEVAFLLRRDIDGPTTAFEAMAAVDGVAPALEIIDSRYEDFSFSLADVVADNASSSGFVVGAWARPDVDLSNKGIVLSMSGRTMQVGTTAAVLGHPARALAALSRLASLAGETLREGTIVLSGGATVAEALRPGVRVRVDVAGVGAASFAVGEHRPS